MSAALRTPRNGSVTKAFQILNALAASRRDMTATALAQATGGTLATTHRFLVTLEEMGAVFRSPRGHFMLGHKLAELGARVETKHLLTEAVQPHLDALAAEFREVAHCATLSGAAAVDIARAVPDRSLVGHAGEAVCPLHCTAAGKMLLASVEPAAAEHLLRQIAFDRHTARTMGSARALKPALPRIRDAGYAIDDEEWEDGLRSLAVPLHDSRGRVVAALAVSGPTSRLTDAALVLVRAALARRAERIEHALFTESRVFPQKAKPRGSFPHLKRVGDFIFLSGTSARRPDDSFEGAQVAADGSVNLDIAAQTRAVFGNISDMLREVGMGLGELVEVQAYLVDQHHYDGFNASYAKFFGPTGPTRTTLVVRALPHPHQILMVRAVAYAPLAALEPGRPAMSPTRW